ncbi:hypothetical protein [Actinopolyspora saharensis]|uniref:hypothetical protein n=1 Tax=Actinopolyspora saharensis TaxID=995062 RepID=UPI003F672401
MSIPALGRWRARWLLLLGMPICLLWGGSAPPEEGAFPTDPRNAVNDYFAANNAAARHGPDAQRAFLRRTQHPDFRENTCSLAGRTVTIDPAPRTLRRDPGFTVRGLHPSGSVWVVAVEVTVRRSGEVVGRQIGSKHLVSLDGRIYGFAPCPT